MPDCAIACAGAPTRVASSAPPRAAARPQISFSRAVSRSASRRELANTIVERCAVTRSTTRSSTCGQIDGRCALPAAEPDPLVRRPGAGSSAMSVDRHDHLDGSIVLADGGCTTVDRRGPPARNVATSSTGRTVADSPIALRRPVGSSASSRSRLTREVRAALGAGHRVHLVDDHRLDAAQRLPGGRGQQQEQRLRRGDEHVGRRASRTAARSSAGVSPVRIADRDRRAPAGRAARPPAGSRPAGAQVALDVDGQGLERGDVQHPAAPPRARPGTRLGREPVQRPQERGQVLPEPVGRRRARAGRCWPPSHAPTCAAVGAAKAPSNHAAVAGENARQQPRSTPASHPAPARATSPAVVPPTGRPAGRGRGSLGRCG